MNAITSTESFETRSTTTRKNAAIAAVAALVVVIVGYAAYLAGERRGAEHLTVRTGRAFVGDRQATITVGGWNYAVNGSVAWLDSSGSFHESGWPACLGPIGSTIKVRFGEIATPGPEAGGISLRTVVWVDCRGALQVQ